MDLIDETIFSRAFPGGIISAMYQMSDKDCVAVAVGPDVHILHLKDAVIIRSLSGGHTGAVRAIAMLPDGRLVTGGSDGLILVWDVSEGHAECIAQLKGHTAAVQCLLVMGDGLLASGGWEGEVRVWDLHTGGTAVLTGHTQGILCLTQLTPSVIASGSMDCTVRVWDVVNSSCVALLEGHRQPVSAVACLASGILVSADKVIRMWDVDGGACLRMLEGHTDTVTTLIPLTATTMFSGTKTSMRMWSTLTGECVRTTTASHRFAIRLTPSEDSLPVGLGFGGIARMYFSLPLAPSFSPFATGRNLPRGTSVAAMPAALTPETTRRRSSALAGSSGGTGGSASSVVGATSAGAGAMVLAAGTANGSSGSSLGSSAPSTSASGRAPLAPTRSSGNLSVGALPSPGGDSGDGSYSSGGEHVRRSSRNYSRHLSSDDTVDITATTAAATAAASSTELSSLRDTCRKLEDRVRMLEANDTTMRSIVSRMDAELHRLRREVKKMTSSTSGAASVLSGV